MARKASSKPTALQSTEEIEAQWLRADEEVRKKLPLGVKLLRTLRGHTDWIGRIAWSPDGRMLASPSANGRIMLWDIEDGKCLRILEGHSDKIWSVAFDPTGVVLASSGGDGKVNVWEISSARLLLSLHDYKGPVGSVAFDKTGKMLAGCGGKNEIIFWDTSNGFVIKRIECPNGRHELLNVSFNSVGTAFACTTGNGAIELFTDVSAKQSRSLQVTNDVSSLSSRDSINCATFSNSGRILASAGNDRLIRFWDVETGKLIRALEGHTKGVNWVEFSPQGLLLASKGQDNTIRFWREDTGNCIAQIVEPSSGEWASNIAFHPHNPLLAVVGSDPDTPKNRCDQVIHIYELDRDLLLVQPTKPSVSYTSAKIVLVGDSGVGKTGLGWRLAHGDFKEHASTHGQQFWLLEQLCEKRTDGTECEAVLWDLAGQPDYRLIHALFLDDADLALILFDPTKEGDPLAGVEFWLRQLKAGKPSNDGPPILLVAARSDRGTPRLTSEELEEFCDNRLLSGYLRTSAKAGEGIEDLLKRMKRLIPWDEKPATVTTETFKRIKDYVLVLKENRRRRKIILRPDELRERLMKSKKKWQFTDEEMLTSVGHLANHGYVTKLKTSQGESRILLSPELLNNLAASLVLEARRNVKGLGSLEEQKLLAGHYKFPELENMTSAECELLLDASAVLFLEHNVCFRETDPNNMQTYLVFPELINLKRPADEKDKPIEDGVAYTVNGAIENVYASLVVLMGYTQTFTRTSQWRNQARYEVGNKQVCGFRLEDGNPGELDFVLYFSTDTAGHTRTLFQSLFEGFLARRSHLEVKRFDPVQCSKAHRINRAVVSDQLASGEEVAFCGKCGEKVLLPKTGQAIHLTAQQAKAVEVNQKIANDRALFERILFRLKTYVTEQKVNVPECFISYAWGTPEHEQWVERLLAADLHKAGIAVVLDRWHNPPGSAIGRFVDRLEKVDRIVVVGTTAYRHKYDNEDPDTGTVVAAECAQINTRMRGPEKRKNTVLPLLLDGTQSTSLPPCLHDQVFSDFRKNENYFATAFELLLSLYQIGPQEPVAVDLRASLHRRAQ
jgi:small GTP-binding protein